MNWCVCSMKTSWDLSRKKHTNHDRVGRKKQAYHLPFSGWKAEFGGFTSYIAHDEDEEVSDVGFN